ncbi:uncharacterized protein LOC129967122 isoform X2 [Argiope bruennichi]|uniref:Apolipoprotein L3 n=2 Tax=Argiope bruennichi TaxID=94029 RepID=A0A8T0E8G4_ARGBR|nr:uncharacterized protein LOC129967122 isoform X2 [Argiope bruennichi]KAF8767616.1 hypothetical protein HNY73_020543 [Argiope bruennichi]
MGVAKSKQKTRDDLKVQIQEFNSRLQTALIGCHQAKKTFITLSDVWCGSRQEVLSTLNTVAEKIDKHHQNVNLATLAGISSSIAGGAAGIGGLILAPMSGGLSLALSAGGLVGTVAGSATTLGASIAEVYLTKDLTEKVQKVLETDAFYTKALSAAFKEIILHEQEVISIISELKNEAMLEDLEKVMRSSPCCDEIKRRFSHLKEGANSLEDILILVKSLYPEDQEFLHQLKKTDDLFGEAPTLSSTLSSSSEFFQAVKELTTVGPETLKSISGAALQSTAASSAQIASCTTQIITAGLGAVFVALDIYQFMKTSKNYDQGSKTELANKMRNVAEDLEKERQQIMKLNEYYRRQIHVDLMSDSS